MKTDTARGLFGEVSTEVRNRAPRSEAPGAQSQRESGVDSPPLTEARANTLRYGIGHASPSAPLRWDVYADASLRSVLVPWYSPHTPPDVRTDIVIGGGGGGRIDAGVTNGRSVKYHRVTHQLLKVITDQADKQWREMIVTEKESIIERFERVRVAFGECEAWNGLPSAER